MNDIRVVLRLFDVSPSINKFLMLSMKVLQGPLDGRTSFVSRKLHLGSNDCTPKARMAAYKCGKVSVIAHYINCNVYASSCLPLVPLIPFTLPRIS